MVSNRPDNVGLRLDPVLVKVRATLAHDTHRVVPASKVSTAVNKVARRVFLVTIAYETVHNIAKGNLAN